jgi:hypothetical protein
MIEEIDFIERYDELLDVKPCYGIDRVKKRVKYDHIGLEIEISVNYERERYTFIRTLLKKIIALVGDNGYFTHDGTIIGKYSFEIVLDPLPVSEIKRIYTTLMQIIKFSDGSLLFDKEHNCGLHMNFNQYDIDDLNESHKRLLLFLDENSNLFDENVYKQLINKFDFGEYLEFQKNVGSKYVAVNYLNKKIVEVRNVKVGLTTKQLEKVMNGILEALFYKKKKVKQLEPTTEKMINIMSDVFEDNSFEKIKESLDNDLLIIRFNKNKAKVIKPDKRIIELLSDYRG